MEKKWGADTPAIQGVATCSGGILYLITRGNGDHQHTRPHSAGNKPTVGRIRRRLDLRDNVVARRL
eukprot:4652521-Prorocentrum_lima.AAC.1